ncbi:MAG TPA: type VI secretion system protein TssA, partial [Blastocatellia bacterium]|nr:type VI secretion system protein TssA [Blastocatellia bacterium]
MSSAELVTELESLLSPIAGASPAGESLKYTGLYDEIREARRADENLEQGEWKRDQKVADWPKVLTLSTDALATRTKDLQVAAWLGEALARLRGFAGLRDSLQLTRGLLERFWESLYPETDDGDLEARANCISWLDRTLAGAIKEAPITKSLGSRNCSYSEWEQSTKFDIPESLEGLEYEQLERVNQLKQQAAEEGKITSEQWRAAKNSTRRAFYEELNTMLGECWHEYQLLDKVADEKFGRQTPGLGQLKKSLDDIRSLIEKLVKEKRMLEPDPVSAEEGSGGETGSAGEVAVGMGPVRTRQEALRRLAEVADYFRR